MRVAVAPGKFCRSVNLPGRPWRGWEERDGSPTYDWTRSPGSIENTAKIKPSFRLVDLESALHLRYDSDAHLVTYYLVGADGRVLERQPRLKKEGLSWVFERGYRVEHDLLMVDVDNPLHGEWNVELRRSFEQQLRELPCLQSVGYYLTAHGCRLVQPLDEPVSASESERYLDAWIRELREAGVAADTSCRDWTRHFRLPHVQRNNCDYVSPIVSLERMTPRRIVPSKEQTLLKRLARGAPRRQLAQVHHEVPETWVERVARLGAALAMVESGGHSLSLGLAGALLERGVSAEAVPAIVSAATAAAGWKAPTEDHYRQNAHDTVMKWSHGVRVRSDVPLALVPVLDEVCGAVPAADATTEADKLHRAIAGTADGLTVVRVACGAGKTRQARLVAAERAEAGLRTTISVPTNELALQVVSDLRAAGVAVARYFGPTSLTGEDACRFRGAASAIAAGQQSVRWELCEGRGKDPCPHLDSCPATKGTEGPDETLVVVGNHALLGELEAVTGKRGLLIVDEPPDVLEDLDVTSKDLALAKAQLGKFEQPEKLAPAVALAEAYLRDGALDVPVNFAEVELEVGGLGALLDEARSEDVQTAIQGTVKRGARAPALVRWQVAVARNDEDAAKSLGEASSTLALLYRALTDETVRVTAYEDYVTGERRLSVAQAEPRLRAALRRDGHVVAMAADAHLHLQSYREVVCYEPTYVEVSAEDGCQVRRVLVERAFSRRPLPKRVEADAAAVRRALDLAADGHGPACRIAVVTYKAREAEVATVARAWANEHSVTLDVSGTSRSGIVLDVGHYGALRGLDRWKHYDGLVTVGDPVPNLSAVSRATCEGEDVLARARDLARAELEQAHGRLRTVHRQGACTQVHAGRLVPYGWPAGFEVASVVERAKVPSTSVHELVMACGGLRASARICVVSAPTVKRWIEGTCAPPTNAVALLQAAVVEGRSGTGRKRRGHSERAASRPA